MKGTCTSHTKPTTATSLSPQAQISLGSSTPQQLSGLLAQAGEQKVSGLEIEFVSGPTFIFAFRARWSPARRRTDQGLGAVLLLEIF